MAFELKPGQALGKNLARIASKQVQKALEQLGERSASAADESVHVARKCFKKVRALLRLVRPHLGEKAFRRANTCLRDAGRPLTEVRDAKILIETFDKLLQHFTERLGGQAFDGVRNELLANQLAARKRVLEEHKAFATVSAQVEEVLERVDDWSDVPDRWPSIGDGLRQVYRQGRRAFAVVQTDPTVDHLHEWRKQAKYLRHQLEILRPLSAEMMEQLANQADRLGKLLGEDHDLAVLRQMLADNPERFGDAAARELLMALIDERRTEFQHESAELGRRLFQDRAKAFVGRLRGYWKTCRAGGERKQRPEETATARA
jgi:CHAD domain-containing protein